MRSITQSCFPGIGMDQMDHLFQTKVNKSERTVLTSSLNQSDMKTSPGTTQCSRVFASEAGRGHLLSSYAELEQACNSRRTEVCHVFHFHSCMVCLFNFLTKRRLHNFFSFSNERCKKDLFSKELQYPLEVEQAVRF